MPGFTVKNLKDDVEDSAAGHGIAGLEARFAHDALDCEQTGLSYQRLDANAASSFGHRHGEEEEIYVVIGGGGQAKLDDDVVDLRRFDALRVAPATMRAFHAGPDGLELLAFGAPARRPTDAEMEPGWWSE